MEAAAAEKLSMYKLLSLAFLCLAYSIRTHTCFGVFPCFEKQLKFIRQYRCYLNRFSFHLSSFLQWDIYNLFRFFIKGLDWGGRLSVCFKEWHVIINYLFYLFFFFLLVFLNLPTRRVNLKPDSCPSRARKHNRTNALEAISWALIFAVSLMLVWWCPCAE